jgi:hypothetical protein
VNGFSPQTRSGCCYEGAPIDLHARCFGKFSRRRQQRNGWIKGRCACPCHLPTGALAEMVNPHRDAIQTKLTRKRVT